MGLSQSTVPGLLLTSHMLLDHSNYRDTWQTFSFCCISRVSWRCGAAGPRAAAEGGATALRPVGRCQCCRRWPKKPTWWQVQPHPGLRPLFFFHSNALFYFLKINTPNHSSSSSNCHLPHLLHMHSYCHVHGPPCPLPPPSNLLFWSFFLLKEENCWQKHFMYLFPSLPFHFSPSCSASRLLEKAWRIACPSFFPVVNGKGKNTKKDLMRGFLNTIKIDMNFLWLILVLFYVSVLL